MNIRQMTAALLAAALLSAPAASAWDGGDAWDPPTDTPQSVPVVTAEPETVPEPAAVPAAQPETHPVDPDDPFLPPTDYLPDPTPLPPRNGGTVTPSVTAEYQVTLMAGPDAEPQVIAVRAGESLYLPDLPDRQSDGAAFLGWTLEAYDAAVQYRAGETVVPGLDMTLYAVYETGNAQTVEPVQPVQPENPPVEPVQPENPPVEPVQPENPPVEPVQPVQPENPPVQPENPPSTDPGSALALRTDHSAFMGGYTSGLFQPEVPLTRAHVSKILYELLAHPVSGTASFTDVNGDEWYAPYVRALGSMGVINPDENGAFRGTSPITRAECAEILSKFVPAAAGGQAYPDVPETHWAYGYIQAVSAAGLFGGDSAGNFNPEGRLTRAQAAAVFNRLLGRTPDGDVIRNSPNVRIFPDVPTDYWAYDQIMEAAVTHTYDPAANGGETWTSISADPSPLEDGYYNFNGYLYRMSGGKFLRNTSADGWTYDGNGRYTTGNDALDGYISGILRKVLTSGQTRTEKLRAVFNYVRDNYTYLARAHVQSGATGWEESYAVDFFERGKGNCFSFSAAFYELARALGVSCKTVIGTVGSVRIQDHGWVEVYEDGNTWLYDTELEMAYRTRGDFRWNLCRFTYNNAPFTYKKLSVSG